MLPTSPSTAGNSPDTHYPGRITLDGSQFAHDLRQRDPSNRLFFHGFTDDEDRVGVPPLEALPLENYDVGPDIDAKFSRLREHAESLVRSEIADLHHFLEDTDAPDLDERMGLSLRGRARNAIDSFVPTLIIILPEATNLGPCAGSWLRLAGQLKEYLSRNTCPEIWVEVLADHFLDTRYMSLVGSSHPFYLAWHQGFQERIYDIIHANAELAKKWLTMDLIRIGADEEANANPVTVSVTVATDLVSHHWQRAKQEIREALDSAGFGTVMVDFEHGELEYTTFDHRPKKPLGLREPNQESKRGKADVLFQYEDVVEMGSAIGPQRYGIDGRSGFGTLGGFLKISGPNLDVKVLGITNYHVLRFGIPSHDNKGRAFKDSLLSYCDQKPFGALGKTKAGNADINRDEFRLECPPRRLHNERIGIQISFIKNNEHKPRYATKVEKSRQLLAQEYAFFDEGRHHLGIPWLTSAGGRLGREREARGSAVMDWALIQMERSRVGTNTIPATGWNSYAGDLELGPYKGGKLESIASEEDINNIMMADARVWKVGAASGATSGWMLAQSRVRRWSCWETQPGAGDNSTELAVISGDSCFGGPGDSGSFVFRESQLVGMLWGKVRKRACEMEVIYVTAITDICDNIRDVAATFGQTGLKIELP
ncbi:hypothetical protein GGR54DRAFT_614696 [Hypoxylon sp. NC1633]|nr:hypothetical protein GGR54DRAFT_614696 [Hypoxylon sp. NC1633]